MVMYLENPIVSTRKLLDLISEFSKIARYEVNIEKLKAFTPTMKLQKQKSGKKSHLI